MSKIRVGHIGAGGKGRQHMDTVVKMEGVELVAVCDPVEPLRTKFADDYGAAGRYDKIETMLENEDLDAAFVTTPAHINAIAALPCLEAGVNTFMEKPPGISLKETQALRDAGARTGAQGMVGFNRRFEPQTTQTADMVRERGPIVQLVCTFHKSMTRMEQLGRWPDELMDNFLWETPIHSIDLMRFLAGSEVAEIHGACRRAYHKFKDVFGGLVYFENGCIGHLIFNMTGTPRLERYEIHGRDVSAYMEEDAYVLRDGERVDIAAGDDLAGTRLEDRYFIECIRDGKKIDLPAANLDEAVKSMEVAHAILQRLLPT